jgi:hypothetical protein
VVVGGPDREKGLVTKDVAIKAKPISNRPRVRFLSALLDVDTILGAWYLSADKFWVVVDYPIAIRLPGGMLILG